MRNIQISYGQSINLNALPGTTACQAIKEAIAFKSLHRCEQVDLDIHGFTVGIELDSDIEQLTCEYLEWRDG